MSPARGVHSAARVQGVTKPTVPGNGLSPPRWVQELLGPPIRRKVASSSGPAITIVRSSRWALATAVISEVTRLDALNLQRRTVEAHEGLRRALNESDAPHPLRVWNFIPDIHSRLTEEFDRYMAFNAGRFAAFCDWFGGSEAFDQEVPTATGIGHDSPDLVIHVLGGAEPGLHLHNPRQRRPYRYSRRFGPFPPCFARATVVSVDPGDVRLVLVGGTASVLDESSVHLNNMNAQLDETFHNLCRLLDTASRAARAPSPPKDAGGLLACFRTMRVYYVRPEDEARLRAAVARRVPHLTDVEFLRAELCRSELLVEIEGTAVV